MSDTIIPKVGLWPDVPPEVYHSWQALSNSWMSKLNISPAHLYDLMENGGTPSTKDQDFGTAVHCKVLEPAFYETRVAVRPEGQSGATKEGKAFKRQATTAHKIVLSHTEGRWCDAIACRAKANRLVRVMLDMPHQTEVSLVWERDGFLCKARADLMVPGAFVAADIKTTRSVGPKGFATQVARYRYHCQAAWYLDGIQRLTGKLWDFQFIVCEKSRPFLVTVHQLARDSPAYRLAVAECDRLFDLYKQCWEKRAWPGYGDSFTIELPDWAVNETSEPEPEVEEEQW